jgi:hypothetical protein
MNNVVADADGCFIENATFSTKGLIALLCEAIETLGDGDAIC